jgi:hypothetical protein
MVRREKKPRIGASVVKSTGKMKGLDKCSAVVKKSETRFFRAASTISSSLGTEEERSEERYLSYSPRPGIAEDRARSRTRSERLPPVHDYSQRREPRVRSEGDGALLFRTMSSQQRQTFLGPLEFSILPVQHTLTDPSVTIDNAEAKAFQERELILGPIEFPSPESTFSEDSDWMGRISSIVNATKASENIDKNDKPLPLLPLNAPTSDADWSPESLPPVIKVDDNNNNRAGATSAGASASRSFDLFRFIFSGCYPVEHEPDVLSKTNLTPPPWKYEHPLTDRQREQACVGSLDFSWVFPSAGSDLSYNVTDLDDGTMVTMEALTLQTTLLSTFTGTNLTETIVDDGSQPSTFDALQLKLQRMGVSVRKGRDNLAEKTVPNSSSPPITNTSISPTPDGSRRPDTFSSATPVAPTPDCSSRLDNLPAARAKPLSSRPPITATPVAPNWSNRLDYLPSAMAMPLSASLPITRTSALPTTTGWPTSPAANNSGRAQFVRSVGNAIRRRDMDASRLQMEIDRLRAKVESAKLKEQGELMGTCNNHRQDNRIRSAPLPRQAGAATTPNQSSTMCLDQNTRSQSVMIRVPCDWLDQ